MIGLLPAYASHFTLVARACERRRTSWNHLHALWVRDGFIDIDIRSVAAGGSLDEHSQVFLSKEEKVDIEKVQIEVPIEDMKSSDSLGGNPFGDSPTEELLTPSSESATTDPKRR